MLNFTLMHQMLNLVFVNNIAKDPQLNFGLERNLIFRALNPSYRHKL